ncbi:MAG: hypothetical protein HOQ12_03150 [Gemmatimonadaceae bacterium]|nr:hypothetical protein [Gemmatimonadaceae bacterium]NUQ91796.1 hypothetical protein [Gemmatimonadaceae bacterium]NUR18508.1 hypothetical protein [Gemmatimonadaceae bacterium]
MLARLTRTLTVATALTAAAAALSTPALAQKKTASKRTDATAQADARAMERYRLTPAVLAKLARVQDNMYAMLKADPSLVKKYAKQKDESNEEDEPQTIDAMAKKLDEVPELKRAITRSGITTREYMLASLAMFQAMMASAVMEMPGADKSKIPATVSANVAFLKAHKAEMDRMNARNLEIQKLTKQQEESEDADAEQEPDTSGGGLR